MTTPNDITIVGAGPFGLSLASHLHDKGLDFRIIGSPMHSWLNNMPKGMLLKSEGFASSLSDPNQIFTLKHYCQEHGIAYRALGLPVGLDTFASYGLAFQQRMVPELEDEQLVVLSRCPRGFSLRMKSGKWFESRKVVLAVGLDYFRHMPSQLAGLPRTCFSHAAEHHDLSRFKGQSVAVLGGGASAIDLAVLLQEAGVAVELIARRSHLAFGRQQTLEQSAWRALRKPLSTIGPGLKNRFFADFPWLYRYLPAAVRVRTAKTFLGPSAGWFMQERAITLPVLLGWQLQQARFEGGRVQLHLTASREPSLLRSVDHVIAATGYQSDVRRLPFIDPEMVEHMRLIARTPRLSAHFESSIPGLYFAGPITATSFGPVMRFAAGAKFSAYRIAAHLARLRAGGTRLAPPAAEPVP